MIVIRFDSSEALRWQDESPYSDWNLYRGDLDELIAEGFYSQVPGSNAIAERFCDLAESTYPETLAIEPGKVAFFLVTGRNPFGESDLGPDSSGALRPHAQSCP